MGGGPDMFPQQQTVAYVKEVIRQDWSWLKWVAGVVSAILAGVVIESFRRWRNR